MGALGGLEPADASGAPASSSCWATPTIVPPSFPVVFTETGLPLGTNWSVTLNGVTESATPTPSISGAATMLGSAVRGGAGWAAVPLGRSFAMSSGTVVASGTSITFQEPVGTYPFSVGRVPGYSPDPSSGKLVVTAPSVTEAITFSEISSTAPSGLPVLSTTTGYYLIGGLTGLVVVVVVVELALRSRRRRQPAESESWAAP